VNCWLGFSAFYPGFLVDDPEGYSRELQSALRMTDSTVDACSTLAPTSSVRIRSWRKRWLAARSIWIPEVRFSPGRNTRTPACRALNEVLRPSVMVGSGHPPPIPSPEINPQKANRTVRMSGGVPLHEVSYDLV